ncbi:MAG: GNAT family N-acetyltransferase [Clostridia bacterium]
MQIRKYQVGDKENLRKICIATAPMQKNNNGRILLTLLYNDYYTEFEKDNCFVVADEEDKAVGYIICSEDFTEYKKTFQKVFLPKIKKLSFIAFLTKWITLNTIDKKVGKLYPAHLHIDLLKVAQSQGFGKQLISTLITHLKEKGVTGINLGVSNNNVRAIKFYEKLGFTTYLNSPFAKIMVKKF